MKMKGSIILKIFLILLCGALLVAFAGLILWDRQQQQEDSARLRQLIETDQSGTDQTSEKTDDGKEPSEDAEAKEDISDGTASETTDQQEEETDQEVPVQGIACWGDEFFSQDEAQYSYKNILQQLLTDNGYQLQVADKTLAGASTLSLMKMAGVPQTDLDQYIAEHTEAAAGAEIPITETGIRDLTADQTDRSDADYIPVIFMGYYGGWNYDPNELAEQEQKILDTFGANKNNYVIVGLAPADGSVDRATYDSTMKEKWGEHYISAAEVTTVPVASQQGQSEIAQAVFQKLEELGYITR